MMALSLLTILLSICSAAHYNFELVESMLQRDALLWMNQLNDSIQNTKKITFMSDQRKNIKTMYQTLAQGLVTNYHRINFSLSAKNQQMTAVIVSALDVISKNEMILDRVCKLGASTKNPLHSLWNWASHPTNDDSLKCIAITFAMQPIVISMAKYAKCNRVIEKDKCLLLKREFNQMYTEISECIDDLDTFQFADLNQQFVTYLNYLMGTEEMIKWTESSSFRLSNLDTLLQASLKTVKAINNKSDTTECEQINQMICDIIQETIRICPLEHSIVICKIVANAYPELLYYFYARQTYLDLTKRVCLILDFVSSDPKFVSNATMDDIGDVFHFFDSYTELILADAGLTNFTARFKSYKLEDCVDLFEHVIDLVVVMERVFGTRHHEMDWGIHNITQQIRMITSASMYERVEEIIKRLQHDQLLMIASECTRWSDLVDAEIDV